MLDRILKEIPKLTAAVVRADVRGNGSYDITRTGAADTARSASRTAKRTTKRTTRKAGRATGTAQPWPGYDNQTVEEIGSRLARASDSKARAARAYEKAHKNRAGVIETADRELSNA
jgi:hypothetical protein